MIVTEEKAKKLFCPHIRILDEGSVTNMRSVQEFAVCIASQCMMWWWIDKEETKGHCGLAWDGQEQ